MRIARESIDRMKKQIALDCNLTEAVKLNDNMYLAPSVQLAGSRMMHGLDPFLRVIVFMGTAYVMADEEVLPRVEAIIKDYPAEWLFNFSRLRSIDRLLNEYGREIADTHIYFLPDSDASKMAIPEDFIWYDESGIARMKDHNQFTAALCYSPTQPDVIAVAAPVPGRITSEESRYNQQNLKGMAGASLDGCYTKQIGINVLPDYRGEGLAVKLVTVLKQRLIEQGDLPFYGTNESHAISRSVGVKSGFLPAFSEIFVKKQENGK